MSQSKIALLRYMMECGVNDREAYAEADPERQVATMKQVAEMRSLMKELFGDSLTTSDRFAQRVAGQPEVTFKQIKEMVRKGDSAK